MNIPSNTTNTRFHEDIFARFRPALTFNGFDSGEDVSHGLGVKQVIERGLLEESLENYLIRQISDRAKSELWPRDKAEEANISRTHLVNHNSSVVQSRCFVALISLVMSHNQLRFQNLDLPSPMDALDAALESLKTNQSNFPLFAYEVESGQDRVKWTKSLMNMSRGIDLYLALENAFAHYGMDSVRLLSMEEKEAILGRLEKGIGEVLEVVDSTLGIGSYISGNWSLKMWIAAAYACLATQKISQTNVGLLTTWFGRALRRASPGNLNDKRRYWTYMTTKKVGESLQDGQRTWAEGPYYLHFALQDVIPFWHAIRAQGYLRMPEHNVDTADPFRSDWFLNPLEWLADIVTPEGGTPPFDDGNRKEMSYVYMLTWSKEYGDERVSSKMNDIYRKLTRASSNGVPTTMSHLDPDMLLVQLAIPQTSSVTPPAPEIGNRSPLDLQEEQVIIRREVQSSTHYVCLHGEGSSDTIKRGEGHEQPDQLQLLYYIDQHSMLMDAGYDRGHVFENSSWNRYTDHNVMAFDSGDSGMKAPHKTLKTVSHTITDTLYLAEPITKNLAVMRGRTVLKWRRDKRFFRSGYKHQTDGHYTRTVMFVNDDTHAYMIDINQVKNDRRRGSLPGLQMRYHINAPQNNEEAAWRKWRINDGLQCGLYFQGVEYPTEQGRISEEDTKVRERFKQTTTIKRFTYFPPKKEAATSIGILTSSEDMMSTNPIPQVEYQKNNPLTHQIWRWDHLNRDIIDIIFARSPINQDRLEEAVLFQIELPDGPIQFISRSRQDVGFARCHKINGNWEVNPNFLYGLEPMEVLVA